MLQPLQHALKLQKALSAAHARAITWARDASCRWAEKQLLYQESLTYNAELQEKVKDASTTAMHWQAKTYGAQVSALSRTSEADASKKVQFFMDLHHRLQQELSEQLAKNEGICTPHHKPAV